MPQRPRYISPIRYPGVSVDPALAEDFDHPDLGEHARATLARRAAGKPTIDVLPTLPTRPWPDAAPCLPSSGGVTRSRISLRARLASVALTLAIWLAIMRFQTRS